MKYAGIAFAMSWIAQVRRTSFLPTLFVSTDHSLSHLHQFVGHGKFEGRAPALLDSLLQSLVLAVFFVWLEVLFFFGYRPQLFKRLQNRTEIEVTKYRREKALKEAKKM